MFVSRPEPSFSVVIPTYRRPRGLARVLNSLAPQIAERLGAEVIVVNDGSDESNYEAIAHHHRGWMKYVVAPKNGGPGAARNIGARHAKSDFLVFIDDDCAAPLDWLEHLAKFLAANPSLDAVGGTTRPMVSPRPHWFERVLIAGGCYPNPVFYRGELIVMVSACLAVRRALFDTLGGFVDKIMPLAEDRNLTTRLRLAGANLAVDRDWFVYHDMSSTPREHFRRYFNYGRGVRNAVALEAVPLDLTYWPPERRNFSYWLGRAKARVAETKELAAQQPTLERLPVVAVAAATNLTMDLGYILGERRKEPVE